MTRTPGAPTGTFTGKQIDTYTGTPTIPPGHRNIQTPGHLYWDTSRDTGRDTYTGTPTVALGHRDIGTPGHRDTNRATDWDTVQDTGTPMGTPTGKLAGTQTGTSIFFDTDHDTRTP